MHEKEINVENLEYWRKKLIFRSWHRGTKEMDLLLGNFADQYVLGYSESQLQDYEALLSINDPDLYNMYLGKHDPEPHEISDVMKLFLAFKLNTMGH